MGFLPNKRLPLSVCVVSGAEAHRITNLLESVKAWAAEIVIVLDSKATDKTEEIASAYGARIFREPWKGFIGQKNSAADKCSQPWLLNLDADETVTPELAEEIASVIASTQDQRSAYEFPRCTLYCGRWIRHGDWYPDRVCRLWKKGAARWAGEEPHARLEVQGSIGRLRSDLLHYTSETIERHIGKIVPYQVDAVRRWQAAGKQAGLIQMAFRPFWRFFRGYILRLGFLDGWQGFYIASLNSFSTLTRLALIREARENTNGSSRS